MKLAAVLAASLVLILILGAWWLYAPDKPREKLEATYKVALSDYVDAAGVRVRVRDTGPRDAPAVILIHGFGSSLDTWDAWADRLQTDRRVVRFDLPGFGLTGPDPSGDYSDAHDEQVLAALMDALGVQRASLIGNSLGGRLAWRFAADHPERVARLVLISPDGFASPGFEYDKAPDVPWMMRLLPYTMPTPLLRASLQPAYGDPSKLTPEVVKRYRDMMLAPGVRRAILDRTAQVMLRDPRETLARIQAPTLLLWGEKDAMIPFANSADYLRAIPNARLVALPGLGHVPFEEDPDTSLAPVRAFLDER
jgi:pimeloyl-ACP methyl ester carboxylesterase